MADIHEETALFIKEKRIKMGISQNQLSKSIGINSKGYISMLEAGKKQASIQTLGKILTALNSKIKFDEL
jgi:transcriptional regulator with XRE-family HTH domain